jgi:uncharacterized membrane protein
MRVVLCACLLFIVNFVVVGLIVRFNLPYLPPWLAEFRLVQGVQTVAPIVLIFVEFWLYDLLADRRLARRAR